MPTKVAPAPPGDSRDNEQLLKENAELKVQVARLTEDNAQLTKQLAQLTKQTEPVVGEAVGEAQAAGIITAGSRVVSSAYADHMAKWASDAKQLLPKQVLQQVNVAAVQQIGPCNKAFRHEKQQIDELEASLKALPKDANKAFSSRIEYQLARAKERRQQAEAKLDASFEHLDAIRLTSAAAISPGLASDEEKYGGAMREMDAAEPGVLDKLNAYAAGLVNTGALKVGEEVEVAVDGAMQRAKVQRAVDEAEGTYELSLWTEVNFDDTLYEAGYNTSSPKLLTVPRLRIYANKKQAQTLSKQSEQLAARRAALTGGDASPAPTSPECLALLYADAERTLPHLHELASHVRKQEPEVNAVAAPLKGEPRAAYKARDKYRGDYTRLTDLARMTFVCTTLRQVQAVLMVLAGIDSFVVLLIKNRLMLEFDASATGGYRDMLLNLLCKATGHIVEVQITLSKLIAVKASGGHASYAIARVHELFEKATFRHEGALSPKLITAVRCGIVRELVCTGTAVGLSVHFDALLEALRAPSCGLRELRLVGCDWPEGRGLSELADALPVGRLKILNVESMQVGSALPATLMDKCTEVELLDLCALGLTGGVPASIGKCAKLKKLILWGNQLEGSIPDEIGQCEDLEELELQKNKLTGGVPASIGKCAKLKKLYLFSNQLEGPIPDEIGQCEDLEELSLSRNKLTGGVPASIGKCAKLKTLSLWGNQLEGTVPASELKKLSAMKQLALQGNERLSITKSGQEEIMRALPEADIRWPTVVQG